MSKNIKARRKGSFAYLQFLFGINNSYLVSKILFPLFVSNNIYLFLLFIIKRSLGVFTFCRLGSNIIEHTKYITISLWPQLKGSGGLLFSYSLLN